ncbi:MAG: PAS domain-containing protein [Bacteroidetes bacterium]|nr:PAS domain-containing protein [Bacteroidota bacterium]
MNYQEKSKEELIKELQELQQENNSIKKETDLNEVKNQVRAAFEKYMLVYFTQRNAAATFAMMGEELSVIGTALDEIALDPKSAKTLYLRDFSQIPNPIEYNFQTVKVQVLTAEVGLVNAVICIKTEIGNSLLKMDGLRLSAIFKKSGAEWIIIHKHFSSPTNDNVEGESYPLQELKKRNQWLEEKINEKTQDLEATNKKLQIDIAERKETEIKLQISEGQKNAILNGITSNIAFVDKDLKIIWANKTAAESVNKTPDEMIGRTCHHFWADPSEPCRNCPSLKAMDTKKSEQTIIHTPDGRVWEERGEPVLDAEGNLIGVVEIATDITERARIEEALQSASKQLISVIESTGDVIAMMDAGYRYTLFNSAFREECKKIFGKDLKPGDSIEEALAQLPNDLEEAMTNWSRALGGEDFTVTRQFGDTNLERNWYELHFSPIRDNAGNVIGAVHIARNVTERKLAEEELLESKERYRTLFENSGINVFILDRDGIFQDMNTNAAMLFGGKPVDFIGKSIFDLNSQTVAEEYYESNRRIIESGVGRLYETLFEFPVGRKTFLVQEQVIKDANGNNVALQSSSIDITGRKQAEEELRESEEKLSALFGAMTEMVAMHELVFNDMGEAINYRITDCNNAFIEITGIQKQDAIGKLGTEAFHTETPPYLEEYARVAISGIPLHHATYFIPMDKHFMISVVSPKKNHFATITTDITAIRHIQEAISAKNKELENYLYVASHDLRSPLVNIQGFSQRLQKQSDAIKAILTVCQIEDSIMENINKITNDDIPKTLNFILSNVTKMDTLLNGLLQISRTGRIKMNIRRIDMNQMFKTIIAAHNFQITEIFAKVIVKDLPDCYGDENQLNQLFSNIIGNALRYRDKTRKLIIEIGAVTQYHKVIYSIKDSGIGIAQRNLEKIWDVFFRVDSQGEESGEGIGLSIAKRIADKHKGKIFAESEEGKGSAFFVELPKDKFSE